MDENDLTIDEWVIVVMGFLQKQGPVNGMVQIWRRITEALRCRPKTQVEIRGWDCDPDDIAELILKLRPHGKDPRIVIAGFSYGGWTAKLITDALAKRGLKVERVITIDAVYRYWCRVGFWRSLLPWKKIPFGETVKRITQFRQRQSIPMGHKIVAKNPGKTILDPVIWVGATHVFMDDQEFIQDTCVRAAIGL